MQKERLGRTGLLVPKLGLGAGHIGDPQQPDASVAQLLNVARERGVTLVDAAPSYGVAELRLGQLLKPYRSDFILSTKCGYGVPGIQDWTGAAIERGAELACRRLQTDHIDILFLHSCPLGTLEYGEVTEALLRTKARGLARAVGYSGEGDALAYAVASGSFDVIQCSVNVCDQRNLEASIPEARRRGMGVLAKRALANAFWRHSERPVGQYAETYWVRAHAMALHPYDMPWPTLALRFAAYAEGVHTALVGTSNPDHLRAHINAVEAGGLPPDVCAEVRARFQAHGKDWPGEV
ncbi:MAG: aldo/keto reductase [Deltaproteobacteria bacterium]|nr:aldo/keto reductase [Deltaproteobacteria bacterium]